MNKRDIKGIDWPEHFSNGGTAVTKGVDDNIRDSVQAFNDPHIYVDGETLHTTRAKPVDLSDFWKFHYERHPLNSKP